jgi:hypothetical protein
MTELQADYVTEALELLNSEPSAEIESPRTVTERRDGKLVEVERTAFIKLYTSFKGELKDLDGDALKVWIYLALSVNRNTKTANPGLRKIAEDTDMAVNTVRAKIEKLDEAGLLDAQKTDGKSTSYRPADYVSVSKFDTVGVSKSGGTVSKNEPTVSVSRRENAQLELTRRNTTRVKRGATPTPTTPPEVKLYQEVTKKYPPSPNYEDVIEKIKLIAARLGRDVLANDLRPFYAAWTGNGWNQFSINWLEYAVKNQLPTPFKKQQTQTPSIPRGVAVAQSWLARKQAEAENG